MFAFRNICIAQKYIFYIYIGQGARKYVNHRMYERECRDVFKNLNKSLEQSEGKIEYCEINNGMRLISEYKKESPITVIGCLLPAGAMFEKVKERGSALFLEHTLLQGTIHKNQQQIEEELQEIGGTLAANATREAFVFYGIAPSQNASKLTELLLDIAINGVIHNNAIELAKCRIFNELSKIESDPEQVVMDYLPSIAYQDTVLAKSVFPQSHIIKNFKTEYLINFKKCVFKPCFMTIISSGAIFLKELQKIVCTYKYVPENSKKICTLIDDRESFSGLKQLRFSGAELRLRDDNEELGYVAIGFEGPTFSQYADRYAVQVAKEIVGSWDITYGGANHNAPYLAHSAFNSNICYLYKSFILDYTCSSIWGCYFVCDKLKLDAMVCMLLSEWRRLYTIITNAEVERAINQCIFHELIKLNNPVDRFFDLVNSFYLCNRYNPMKERFASYQKITPNTIQNIATKYIYDQSPAIVGFGRIENLTDYCTIHRGTCPLYY